MTFSIVNHPQPKPVLGYTTRLHLLIDLDDTTPYKAIQLTKLIIAQYPKVGNCLIAVSSVHPNDLALKYSWNGSPYHKRTSNDYHLVFNNIIGYNSCCRILSALSGLQVLEKDYMKIREFRGDMTLRVSPTILTDSVKPIPVPIAFIFNRYITHHDNMISHYYRVLRASRSLFSAHNHTKAQSDNSTNGANNGSEKYPIEANR